MASRATVTDVHRNFSEYISRVTYRGESFVLTRGGKPVAELVPSPPAGRKLSELADVLTSLPRLSEEEAARFGEDLDSARADLRQTESPWES